ncbi:MULTISPECIES: protein translocase subunit SecD [Acinetobacter]|jgi:preprotein translocase subunit SecD|uniref:Protein translocase subunit SecD n=2 Tax=Acinetobacter guillouiae TaxID=106649 RepID=N8YF40_ACIGI|nr:MULTISPECIES: protein translocase subunit SecD [Acinetobacter]MDN5416329.1 protein translocase subunit SecD [Acinetobacter sp.]ENU59024.1 protein-export membrane protein SecD [Acinetobacter guillouiae CIP 63.46]ENV18248.1 protein-export membrane protein SecD [Acinetobacter guillouiae NIPH 991]EPH33836.1 Protein-export membrane protein SecD [Acinetobacter guillouiae MSP4-18]KAB0625768.1 protein translocase subunit SecD [Acinetobacter guillouiae]
MRYPAWKYILILVVLVISTLYALPSLYPDEPAVQISGAKAGTTIDQSVIQKAEQILKSENISSHDNTFTNNAALLRLNTSEAQLKAKDVLSKGLGENYTVALNLAPTTPEWLQKIGAKPMKLGLDLRGGVHFLLEVDMDKAIAQRMETSATDLRREFRDNKIKFNSLSLNNNTITIQFANNDDRAAVMDFLRRDGNKFNQQALATDTGSTLKLTYNDATKQDIQSYALNQNLTTLRNRINELGVAEALVQSQGSNRIVVELPGVQDTAEAKRVLGRTANLEFRLVSDLNDQYIDRFTGKYNGQPLPPGTEVFAYESLDSGRELLLNRSRILTGERVQNASSGFSQDSGGAEVNITLDTAGGKLMSDATRTAVGKRMAVLFIENKQKITSVADPVTGAMTEVRTPYTESVVINAANIQAVLGSSFRITGLDSPQEAAELALMLRAGALAAPMYFVEERVVGPSLGQENIDKGVLSTQVGFLLVAIWMIVFFRLFGLIADVALVINLAMLLTIMSWIGASLTLPGIAGIVITIGMAVDANVLICERIREEMRWGASPKQAIIAGYDRAYNTILDSNLTTFLVAFILFAIGTGPIKGFAVTLMIGIICSMFTAITVTRAIVQLVYGRKRNLNKLSI